MTRFELLGRIITHLHQLDDKNLLQLLAQLDSEITDETLNVITHGADDTEHLLNNPNNASDLEQAIEELKPYTLLIPETGYVTWFSQTGMARLSVLVWVRSQNVQAYSRIG